MKKLVLLLMLCAFPVVARAQNAPVIARAAELSKTDDFAGAQKLLETELDKTAATATGRDELQIALADVRYAWADKLSANGDYPAAVAHYLMAYEIDRKLRPAYAVAEMNQVGSIYFKLGRPTEAATYFERALPHLGAVEDKQAQVNILSNASQAFMANNQAEQAAPLLERALPLLRDLKNRKDEAATLIALGALYRQLGRPAETVRVGELALPILRELNDRSSEATQLNNIGLAWNSLSEYGRALDYYAQALPIFREINHRAGEATTLGNIGLALDNLSRYGEALDSYNQALPILRAIGGRNGEANMLNNIASIYDEQSRSDEALDFYNQSLAIFGEIKDDAMRANVMNNIGLVYMHLSRLDEGLEFFQRALEVNGKNTDRRIEGALLSNIGSVYLKRNSYEEALRYFERSLQIRREMGDRNGEANTLASLGVVYQGLAQFEKSLDFYGRSLQIRRAIGDRQGEAFSLDNMASIYTVLGRYDEALKNSRDALNIQRELGLRKGMVTALLNMGIAQVGLGDSKSALDSYEEALNLTRQIGDRVREANALHEIGEVYVKLGRLDWAMTFYGKALPLRREVQDRGGEAATLNSMMIVSSAQKQGEPAIFYGKRAVNLTQSMRRDIQGLDQTSRDTFLRGNALVYQNLARLLIDAGRFAEANEVLAMLQQNEFLDFVRRDARGVQMETFDSSFVGAEATVVAEQNTRVESVAKLSAEAFALTDLDAPTPAQSARLVEVQTSLKAARPQLDAFFAAMPARFARNPNDVAADRKSLSAIVPLLREMGKDSNSKVALVSAFVDNKGLELLLTLPSGQTVNLSYAADEKVQNGATFPSWLNAQIFDFKNAIEKRAPVENAATSLWNIVGCRGELGAQLEGAGIDTVMWRLTGPLRAIPLTALRDRDGYLVEKYRNVVLTAGSSELNLAHQPVGDWRALGVGVTKAWTIGGDQFSALGGVEGELQAVMDAPADGFDKGVLPGRVLQDEKFSEANFFRQLRGANPEANSPWQVVHIASHFKLAGDNLKSFLLTGDGKALTIADLQERAQESPLFPGVELMTLSACDTASGGQGADSLGALAELNGARSVLATLWPVADQETAQLMADFYANHAATPGAGKAVALQKAQLKLLHAGGVAAHPYYWAPFVLMGNWR